MQGRKSNLPPLFFSRRLGHKLIRMMALAPVLMAAASALLPDDPVTACRAAHAGDAARHVACLEAALQERQPDGQRQGAAAPAAPAAPTAPAISSAPEAPTGLGAEQVRSASDHRAPPQEEAVKVASVTYDALGRGIFRTAAGQTWREMEAGRRNNRLAAGREYDARIEKSTLGGYRMYIDGVRRMLKVERLE